MNDPHASSGDAGEDRAASPQFELLPAEDLPPPPRPVVAVPMRRTRRARRRRRPGPGALALSIAIHATLGLLLTLILASIDWRGPEQPVRFAIAWRPETPPDPEHPEAREGESVATDSAGRDVLQNDAAKSTAGGVGDSAAPSDAHGRRLDERVDSETEGVGGAAAGSPFAGRRAASESRSAAGGGDAEAEGALLRALAWLARHQSPDGTWDARDYVDQCEGEPCGGAAPKSHTDGATALALLAFLGAGHDHRAGPFKTNVRSGLDALLRRQQEDGSFGAGQSRTYETALGTFALSEAYGLTHATALRLPMETAVARLAATQSRAGGWRYTPGVEDGDASVSGWVTLALLAARQAGADVPAATLAGCRRFFAAHVTPDGSVGYVGRGTGGTALLGVGGAVSLELGRAPSSPEMVRLAERLRRAPPRWSGDPDRGLGVYGPFDPSHWYYGSLAAFQFGGETWAAWSDPLLRLLLRAQRRDGDAQGSFDPRGGTGSAGGRLVTTALAALCLEVTYRYPRVTGER